MRFVIAATAAAAVLLAAAAAQAEKRIFIIENQRDGYGVDQCLASGANCGKPVASAYCQSRQFAEAVSFRKVDRDEITGGPALRRAAPAARPAPTTSPSSVRADLTAPTRRRGQLFPDATDRR